MEEEYIKQHDHCILEAMKHLETAFIIEQKEEYYPTTNKLRIENDKYTVTMILKKSNKKNPY